MHNQSTQRSLSNSKYVTPRKAVTSNKRVSLFVQQREHSTAYTHSTKQWKITDFHIVKQMGKGKFGDVYAALEKSSDYLVALKKMSKQDLKDNDFQSQVKRQIIIQASLTHCNILRLFGYFWDNQHVYLILEYAPGGQIFHILQKNKRIPESQVSIIIRQVCEGLQYLHSKNIIHRDIKPENILLSGQNIKIGDFGWSIHTQTRRQTLCGTLDYLAPEIIKGETHDQSIDVWQLGILAYELAVGHPPFETNTNEQTYQRILNEEVQFPNFISYELRKFIRKILQKNPQKRIQCCEIIKEPFIQKYSDLKLNLKY